MACDQKAILDVVVEMEAMAPEGLEPVGYHIMYRTLRRWIKELKHAVDGDVDVDDVAGDGDGDDKHDR